MLHQRHKTNDIGFTLIELLVAIGVFLAVGTVIGLILSASLRSSTKSSTITNVRQNGTYAITQMAKMIRAAQHWDISRGDGVSQDNTTYTTACVSGAQYHYLKVTSSSGVQTKFTCTGSPANLSWQGAAINAPLIDTNIVALSGSCTITCQMNSSGNPLIGISFSLLQKNTVSTFIENIISPNAVPFKTSIEMRN